MYFVVSAGGTAGHVNPALAVADELRARGHEILFVGTPDHIEAELAKKAGFEFVGFQVAGFNKSKPWTLLSSGMKVMKAANKAKAMFSQRRPDAVLGFGAYVSIPVGRAAASLNIPLIIHEQNSVPGMANCHLAKKAQVTALAYEQAAAHMECLTEPVVCGNPVRRDFETSDRATARQHLGLDADALVLLAMGGSLGAQHINTALAAMKDSLLSVENLHVIQSTGSRDYQHALEELDLSSEEQPRWEVHEYIENMGEVLASADVVISRAGASSLAEIMTLGIPSVLVPYPYARGDHQTINASACVEAQAACMVADGDVEKEAFSQLVLDLLGDPERRLQMHENCAKFSGSAARNTMADLAEKLGGEK